jgi:hypothetical protein
MKLISSKHIIAVKAMNAFYLVVFLSYANALSTKPTSPTLLGAKQNILNLIDGPIISPADIFACPESLAPLKVVRRYFGASETICMLNQEDKKIKYPIYPGKYIDLTIRQEVDRPLCQQTIKEKFGQGLFQNPIVSYLYERGWRQQFNVRELSSIPSVIY